ncbi:portal protein [Stenotrophomonas muris]|uniref:portal protein n=1 Tax=Stenotrophomonas muris TaxID=2963283 RepID=UPI0040555D7A
MTDASKQPVVSAKGLWNANSSAHSAPLTRARTASALTIPSLLPPEGSNDSSTLTNPYQSLGSRGVNNLASKMLMALFPPGSAPFRYTLSKIARQGAGTEDTSEVEAALAQRESDIMDQVEASPQRPILYEYFLHLIVAGNAVLFYPDMQNVRMYTLDQFRARRTPSGAMLDLAILEKVSPAGLPLEVVTACDLDPASNEDVEMYTAVQWRAGKCVYWQEINDIEVPGSRSTVPADKAPWIVGRWKAVPSSHYGRGHIEELLGDLISYDGICEAIVRFAAVAAKIVFLKHPSSSTRIEDITNAESGDCVAGSKADIDVLQLEKYADFQVAQKTGESLEQRLSQAFLLQSGTTRNAERVTAEEIRQTAQELEDVVGGIYTVQSQDLQLPWVNRTIHILEKGRLIPQLPKGSVTPVIVTGFQALGRNHQLNQLRGFVADVFQMLTPQYALPLLNAPVLAQRLGTGWGVTNLTEILKSPEQIKQEQAAAQQQAMASNLIDKAAGPMAQGVARGDIDPSQLGQMAQQ